MPKNGVRDIEFPLGFDNNVYSRQQEKATRDIESDFRVEPRYETTSLENIYADSEVSSVSSTKVRILNNEHDILKAKISARRINLTAEPKLGSSMSSDITSPAPDDTDIESNFYNSNERGTSLSSVELMKPEVLYPRTKINPYFVNKTGISQKIQGSNSFHTNLAVFALLLISCFGLTHCVIPVAYRNAA